MAPFRRRLSLARHPSTAAKTPSIFRDSALYQTVTNFAVAHGNFYRAHLIAFTFLPLIASGIMFASNGDNKIAYIDCLFMCVSSMTVTGLNSVLMNDLTTWQQVMLFLNMTIGSISFVSIITIVIRLRFFRRKFEYMVEHDPEARSRVDAVGAEEAALEGRVYNPFSRPNPVDHLGRSEAFLNSNANSPAGSATPTREVEKEKQRKKKKKKEKLRADMIKRIDVPVRVNEMNVTGWLSEKATADEIQKEQGGNPVFTEEPESESSADATPADTPAAAEVEEEEFHERLPVPFTETRTAIQFDDSSLPSRTSHAHLRRASDSVAADIGHFRLDHMPRTRTMDPHLSTVTEGQVQTPTSPTFRNFPRSRTIEFRDEDSELRLRRTRTHNPDPDAPGRRPSHSTLRDPARTLTRTGTYQPDEAITSGFGGFPNPILAAASFARSKIPALNHVVERNLTMPRTTTLASTHSVTNSAVNPHIKPVSYISFDAVVGRNSKFHNLTTAQEEELGGVEYRALVLLLRIVVGYWLLSQLLAVLVLAPWISQTRKYLNVLEDDAVNLNSTWFVFFQVWSAFSNNGMSLVDQSMVPFGDAYLLIIVMCILILGGNTAYPIFLRLCIWIISKLVPRQSRTRETLQFLLDHPRRCFIYLFPSHQTWFLVFALVCLNSIDWVSFLVLDIGNPAIEVIPTGTRVIDGLFQAFAVRAAGFSVVSLSSTAPALQLLYVIMMYVAVYPIAVSIRSTNVYEEKSLGVFDDEEDEDDVEARFEQSHSATQYISYHARKQLAFDMWWLVLALWLICIIERGAIGNADYPEITIFTLMFEVTSSYGTVGLSLGNTRTNTSLAGVLRTLSKLILCAVMIRGRHRGLPVAIDRSIILPSELDKRLPSTDTASTKLGRRTSRVSVRSATNSDREREREREYDGLSMRSGGLEAVQSETDQARVERVRQESEGASMSGAVDHGFGFTKPVTRWQDEEGREHVLGGGGGADGDGEASSEGSKEILAAEEAKRVAAAEEQRVEGP
ncbi:cation transport protein-domain-containing protein [Leucosporidium creatinivorum]|uniref:Potassium transport protein n=1 Tax=Leucosporidium creatinivorum TaxID=106004 RepID=A0A1Y2EVS9_9BASI|nr:cation transport protein-domain-containing protein [Leucosporidium creatinivorum]